MLKQLERRCNQQKVVAPPKLAIELPDSWKVQHGQIIPGEDFPDEELDSWPKRLLFIGFLLHQNSIIGTTPMKRRRFGQITLLSCLFGIQYLEHISCQRIDDPLCMGVERIFQRELSNN